MSQFYDLASLVVIPSGYKASTIYAQKPLTTDGQLSFSRASTATRVNASGLIEAVASNVPRLDYLGSSCPRLLLEPQRTNLFTFSESFDNAAWVKDGATITANAAVSPDGYTNADLQTGGSVYQQQTQPNATACTMSVFVKKSTASNVTIGYIDTSVTFVGGAITYTYATNTITVSQSANATVSGEAVSYGNGWYRLIIKYTSAASVTFNYQYISAGGSFIYGAQFETSAAYATSYIPTLGASVTRVADAASKTGISSLIGQTEGTLFVEAANLFLSGSRTIALLYTSGSAYYQIYLNSSNEVRVDVNGSFIFLGGSIAANTNYKIAFAYKSGEYALYINGTQIATSASTTVPSSLTDYYLGNSLGSEQSGAYSESILFKTRLTNAQLAELTTL
jgi:hypothetical protein